MTWSREPRSVLWTAWAVALATVIIGLGLQVRYAYEVANCNLDDRLVLCIGPLADWLMPATVVVGLGLVALGTVSAGRRH